MWGLGAGVIVVLALVAGGVLVAYHGSPAAGATMATVPVIGLAGVFVYGAAERKKEREGKNKNLVEQITKFRNQQS
jgi:hypothetical protein